MIFAEKSIFLQFYGTFPFHSTINYAEFFEKMVRANFRNFHALSKIPNLSHTAHSLVKQEFSLTKVIFS